MEVRVFEDGSSAMVFSKEEAELHQRILQGLIFRQVDQKWLKAQWMTELEMAKFSHFAVNTRQ